MSSPPPAAASHPLKKWLVPFLVADLLILAAVAFWLWPRPTGPGLYVYYPENTAFFFEMEASEAQAKGVLTFIEQEQARARQLLGALGKSMPNQSPAFLGERLTQDFVTTFKPQMSLGAWPASANASSRDPQSVRYLVVLPLKSAATTGAELMAKIGPERFSEHTFRKIPYWVERAPAPSQPPMTLAVVQHALMMSGSPMAMEAAIAHALDRPANVFDNEALKPGLSRLPAPRQGTLVTNSAVFAPDPDPRVQQVNRLAPSLFGALRSESRPTAAPGTLQTRMTLDLLAPLTMTALGSEALRGDVRKALGSPKSPFLAAQYLPADTEAMVSLGRLDALASLIMDHGLTPEQKQTLMGAQFVLGMAQIDLRKDLVGLLGGEVALGGTLHPTLHPSSGQASESPPAIALLSRSEAKSQTLQKLFSLAGNGLVPLKRKTEQMGSVAVEVFSAPGQPVALGVATLKNAMIVLGATPQLTQLVAVSDGKAPSLSQQPLYQELTENLPKNGMAFVYVAPRTASAGKSPVRAFAGVMDVDGDSAVTGRLNLLLTLPAAGATAPAAR